jgi:hypothetical protein
VCFDPTTCDLHVELAEQHKQGVVALLGGEHTMGGTTTGTTTTTTTTTTTSSSSSLGTSNSSGSTSNIGKLSSKSNIDSGTVNSGSACTSSSHLPSTFSSSLPVQEPASLAGLRQEHDITLAELFAASMWLRWEELPESQPHITSCVTNLLQVFSAEQIPMLPALQAAIANGPKQDGRKSRKQLGNRTVTVEKWDEGPLRDIYLSWMQASLQKVIKEAIL